VARRKDQFVADAFERTEAGFQRLVQVYNKALTGYFQAQIPCILQDAEDAAQETWLRVWPKFSKLPDEGGYDPARSAFYTYVVQGFARYIVLEKRRQRGKNREVSVPFGTPVEEDGMPDVPDSASSRPNGWSGPSPRPDELSQVAETERRRLEEFHQLHRLVFLCGGYPHQQLAFGFCKIVYGTGSTRGIEGDPVRVSDLHGMTPLKMLEEEYVPAFVKESGTLDNISIQRLHEDLGPLKARFAFSVHELVRLDPASSEQFKDRDETQVGVTSMRDYYTGKQRTFPATISDWCDRVGKRVRASLGLRTDSQDPDADRRQRTEDGLSTPAVCRHYKLRHLPPCSGQAGKVAGVADPSRTIVVSQA
jgi:DNA-directed RNA polymerase specialized sigma24 family protein